MNPISRRAATRGILAGTGMLVFGGLSASLSASGRIAIPNGTCVLSRALERTLHDGAMLKVSRSWEVQFSPQGRGFGIAGEQISAEVDAPPSLAGLAAIEEARSTETMWPILLSAEGRIVAAGGKASSADVAAAIGEAERLIADQPLSADQDDLRIEYLKVVARAGSSLLEELPPDLFRPIGGTSRTVRELSLPGGITGDFEAVYDAVASEDGWLDHATRQVTTRIEGTQQRAVEQWAMTRG